MPKRILIGTVVSDKTDKTVVVKVEIWGRTNPRTISSAADVMEILRTAMG